MTTDERFRELALAFPETTEGPHFEKTAFKVKKKIFATLDHKSNTASLKLSETDQHIFSSIGKGFIYPVKNKWGTQGWTIIELNLVHEELVADALTAAYCEVAPKKLAEQIQKRE